jgi:quinol monooxygenase YgiN
MELTIEISVRPGKLQELYQTLQALLPTIRHGKGCLDCQVARDVENEGVFILSARWEARSSLEHYMRSSSGMALLGAIDLLSERAAARIDRDARWEGIDVLRRMRRGRTAEGTTSPCPKRVQK